MIGEYELELANLEKPIDMYEPEPREELVESTECELTMSGRRYPLRERRVLTTYASQDILLTNQGEPECYNEAMNDKHEEKWLSEMQEEMNSLHEDYTYDLVELPKRTKSLRNKWVYKVKAGEVDNAPKYKAHIVVKGFQ